MPLRLQADAENVLMELMEADDSIGTAAKMDLLIEVTSPLPQPPPFSLRRQQKRSFAARGPPPFALRARHTTPPDPVPLHGRSREGPRS